MSTFSGFRRDRVGLTILPAVQNTCSDGVLVAQIQCASISSRPLDMRKSFCVGFPPKKWALIAMCDRLSQVSRHLFFYPFLSGGDRPCCFLVLLKERAQGHFPFQGPCSPPLLPPPPWQPPLVPPSQLEGPPWSPSNPVPGTLPCIAGLEGCTSIKVFEWLEGCTGHPVCPEFCPVFRQLDILIRCKQHIILAQLQQGKDTGAGDMFLCRWNVSKLAHWLESSIYHLQDIHVLPCNLQICPPVIDNHRH